MNEKEKRDLYCIIMSHPYLEQQEKSRFVELLKNE